MNPPKRRSIAGLILLLVAVVSPRLDAQQATIASTYSPIADSIYRAATGDSLAYVRLGRLVDTFGHRLSGSPSLEAAIDWMLAEMKSDGLENVRGEPVMVPHWVRGASRRSWSRRARRRSRCSASAAASARRRTASPRRSSSCRASTSWSARAADAKGKIVLFDAPFTDYGATGGSATDGPSAAARRRRGGVPHPLGGVSLDPEPAHRRACATTRPSAKIPAAALSVEDAMMLHRFQDRGEPVMVTLGWARACCPTRRRATSSPRSWAARSPTRSWSSAGTSTRGTSGRARWTTAAARSRPGRRCG